MVAGLKPAEERWKPAGRGRDKPTKTCTAPFLALAPHQTAQPVARLSPGGNLAPASATLGTELLQLCHRHHHHISCLIHSLFPACGITFKVFHVDVTQSLFFSSSLFLFFSASVACSRAANSSCKLRRVLKMKLHRPSFRSLSRQLGPRPRPSPRLGCSAISATVAAPQGRVSCSRTNESRRGYAAVSAGDLRFGQPVHETHPHILQAGERMFSLNWRALFHRMGAALLPIGPAY